MYRITITIALLTTLGCGPSRLDDGATSSGETGSDTASSTETSSADTSDEAQIIPKDDVMPEDCDPYQQDCPEGEKCVPYGPENGSGWENKCVPIMGQGEPGDPCWYVDATDDCGEGSVCWAVEDVNGELVGTCHALCGGSPDNPECPDGSICAMGADSSLAVCTIPCDPLLQDCPNALGCYWTSFEFQCVTPTLDLPTGAPCGFINDCAIGHNCTAAEALPSCDGSACCAPFCELGLGDEQCEALPGTSCLPLASEGQAPAGNEHVGLCISP